MERGEDSAGREYMDSSSYREKEDREVDGRKKEQVMISRICNAAHEGEGGIEERRSDGRKKRTHLEISPQSFMCAN